MGDPSEKAKHSVVQKIFELRGDKKFVRMESARLPYEFGLGKYYLNKVLDELVEEGSIDKQTVDDGAETILILL